MKKLAFFFGLCFVPRLAYHLWNPVLDPASNYYWRLSDSLLRFGTLGFDGVRSTAFEPLYPLFLGVSRWLTRDHFLGVILLQIAVASIGCIYFYKLCLEVSKNETLGAIGVFLYSFYPYYVHQSTRITEIPILTTLLILFCYYFSRATDVKNFFSSGIALGLLLLIRFAVLPIGLFALTALLLKKRFLGFFVTLAATLLLVFPLLLRNYRLDGSFLLTRSGLNFFEANGPYSDKMIPAYSTDLLNVYAYDLLGKEPKEKPFTEAGQVDRFFTHKALQFIKENPFRTLKLKLLNPVYLFHPRIVPYHGLTENTRLLFDETGGFRVENFSSREPVGEWAHTIAYSLIFLTAIYGVFLRKNQLERDTVLWVVILGFVIVYSVYFPTTKLRAPMDFTLMFYSACALSRWIPTA